MELLLRIKHELKRIKNKKLKKTAKYLYKRLGITANYLTFLSLLNGLLATYFLFQNHLAFSIFILISIGFDILDGAVAQVDHSKARGWWLDLLSDRGVMFLILVKTYFHLHYVVLLPTFIIYAMVVGLIAYATVRLEHETKYVLNIGLFYLLYILKFYREGVYVLLAFLTLSLIWVMGQMREMKI